ncbi:tRNA (guanosine(18)-2'-O)-methyltransferase [Mariniflexile rhizosphaerae]|uniref:TrmH family RNA methyltransferase n=1 Tax=unclassified Mariniflexile TaxID=2643887 RepID=UPI000CC8813B|nr:RNA methyltransferase [Mariniflexile sp. TRM1-10]AXP79671.1 tRNA (guanosine(18)-2'-O)-methyltransferase [Mariniflexile sp. TRM1-10]PLB18966.1 MAG: RNA methyltransferase, TrmH family [Flavobacteriaceae bacterium FS1-H7996/R]
MLSKSQIKLITSLKQKKYRQQHGFFVVEGVKTIKELLQSHLVLHALYTTEPFNIDAKNEVLISETDLKRISFLTTPNTALAIFEIPQPQPIEKKGLIVALDAVRDPGNLGTIIRLCDWFGVKDLVCSNETVDCFNPKVVQATMGSIARVAINYIDLADFLKSTNLPIFGAFMEGENVYAKRLPENGILVMGNEANGISKEVEAMITDKIAIPRFGDLQATESLNVATATAILLSEFRRGNWQLAMND